MTIIRMLTECFYGGYSVISQDTMKRKYPQSLIQDAMDSGYISTCVSEAGTRQFAITNKGKELI